MAATIKVSYATGLKKIYLPDHTYNYWQSSKGKLGYCNDAAFASFLLDLAVRDYSSDDGRKQTCEVKEETLGNSFGSFDNTISFTKTMYKTAAGVLVPHNAPAEEKPQTNVIIRLMKSKKWPACDKCIQTDNEITNFGHLSTSIEIRKNEDDENDNMNGFSNNEHSIDVDVHDGSNIESTAKLSQTRVKKRDRTCQHCEPAKTFCRRANYTMHVNNYHKPCQCEVCGERFAGSAAYRKHVRYEHTPPSTSTSTITCTRCNQMFRNNYRFMQHNYYYHDEGEMFTCQLCPWGKFLSAEELENHMRRKHSDVEAATANSGVSRRCGHCEQMFYSDRQMRKHVKQEHSEVSGVTCDICQKRVSDGRYLAIHKATVHSATRKIYNCSMCDKTFTTLCGRRMHFDAQHKKIRYQCSQPGCGKMYVTKNLLMVHMGTEHEVKPPDEQHMCCHCGKRFNHPQKLHSHLKIHKPHTLQCDQCNKVFKDLCKLKTHIAISHDKIKNFKCYLCSKLFGHKAHLKRHLDQVHGVMRNITHLVA